MSSISEAEVLLAKCSICRAYSFPADVYGCRSCGASGDALTVTPGPAAPRLRNFVTVHSALAPGLQVPCVIGEVELAPGVVEEGFIEVADESALTLGQALRARRVDEPGGGGRWAFDPIQEGGI